MRSVESQEELIDVSRLNDDFCDCPDSGVDETASNACDKGRFYCKSKFAIIKYISSFKVNDGYCDCCDCSDEFEREGVDRCLEEFKRYVEAEVNNLRYVRRVASVGRGRQGEAHHGEVQQE
eukprot:TRINITY_DN9642_c0_g1_i15.p2 TRINITY_DN9642_c0_g1~~TRINITY_DN9642_c0_g1_i15.p2  ORF type:complete len:121 (+),score=34.01 TRINITY_DN9642_c0_g1_i15:366-728(+)